MVDTLRIDFSPDAEHWWGGATADGEFMPFGRQQFGHDLAGFVGNNQANPMLVSSNGRWIWSPEPISFSFRNGVLEVQGSAGEIEHGVAGTTVRDAFRHVASNYFAATGDHPDPMMFTAPQYNSWIEMGYQPSQARVLAYAEGVLANGFPPGVLMIDDNWHEDYGSYRFHPGKFPDPRSMTDRLHELGFKVMVWVCPYVSPDGEDFRILESAGHLVRTADGDVAIRKWWNGHSAVLDTTNPAAVSWLHRELDSLMENVGVDGFKFDGGDLDMYRPTDQVWQPGTPNEMCASWARVGLRYPLNEYRACWRTAGESLAQRLNDRPPSWGESGLAALLPQSLAQGMLGYAFTCPDMIGGGFLGPFLEADFEVDQELFVRWAQCSALMPMMQFSFAPWRALDSQHLGYCRATADLHVEFSSVIERLAKHAAATGEPIMRPLDYVFPHQGHAPITDQFMLGDDILVAPVVEQGARQREVIFPPGVWHDADHGRVVGPTSRMIDAPLARLPWFRRTE